MVICMIFIVKGYILYECFGFLYEIQQDPFSEND